MPDEEREGRSTGDESVSAVTGQRASIDFLILAERAEVFNGKLYMIGGVIVGAGMRHARTRVA
jgi:hypothetical protein